MKEDLKNVIITFGLIALVFTGGSLFYQKKVLKDYIEEIKQESLLKNKESIAKIEENRILLNQLQQQQIALEQITKSRQSSSSTTSNGANKTPTDLAQEQAQALAQQKAIEDAKAQAKLLAQKQAEALAAQQALLAEQAQAKASTRPSRTSSAS